MANVKMIAITQIDRVETPGKAADPATGASAVRPKIKSISPGTLFLAPEAEVGDLESSGAAVRADAKDLADDATAQAKAKAVEDAASAEAARLADEAKAAEAAKLAADEAKAAEAAAKAAKKLV